MSDENIVRNMLCAQGQVDAQRMRTLQINKEENARLLEAELTAPTEDSRLERLHIGIAVLVA